jgi:hypothetical protein
MTSAVLYVVSKYLETDTAQCAAFCSARGYEIAAVVKDDYGAALKMLCTMTAAVLVVAHPDRLTADCTPRTEIVGGEPVIPAAANHRRRRTRRLFRPGGGA